MTAQEQQLIDELVERIRSTPVQNKDGDAEQRLQQGLAQTPDALYVLAQTVIVQKYGLEQAQQRLQAMQSELESLRQHSDEQKSSGGSFLSHIFGGSSSSNAASSSQPTSQPSFQQGSQASSGQAWSQVNAPLSPNYGQSGQPGYSPQGYPQQAYPQPGYPPPPAYAAGGYGAPGGYGQPSGWGASPSGGGGFLQGALQTAAGVAMGEMAVQSVESLFRGFGGHEGYGRGFENGDRASDTVINNYNDDGPRHEQADESRGRNDSSFYDRDNDASRDDDARGFVDSGDSENVDDSSAYDSDNSGSDSDDTGDFDDSSDNS